MLCKITVPTSCGLILFPVISAMFAQINKLRLSFAGVFTIINSKAIHRWLQYYVQIVNTPRKEFESSYTQFRKFFDTFSNVHVVRKCEMIVF